VQRLNHLAEVSVARGCGFAALGIATLMVGFAGDLRLSLAVGGCASLLVVLILLLKAWYAPRADCRRTELWIMLEPHERPPPAAAQQVIGRVLNATYLRFALYFSKASAVMLASSLIVRAW
jgi:hypothetical protein